MPKTGVDDFLASGRTVAELKLLARPFNPEDLTAERLTRDDQLREALDNLRAECRRMPAVKMAECSMRAAMRDFIRTAERSGKLVEDGVHIIRSARDGADGAQMSLGGWKKAIDRLEAAGRIGRDFWGRAGDKPGAYVLLTPSRGGSVQREHNGGEADRGERQANREEKRTLAENPLSDATFPIGVHAARASFRDEVEELRWPKVIMEWERRGTRRVVVSSEYVHRLGKRRREIIAYLWEAGGRVTVEELRVEYGARRGSLRDFRRWILSPLTGWRYDRKLKRWMQFGPPIIAVDGDYVRLVDEWREALELHRKETGEIEDARLQAERHAREKKAFRRAAKEGADPTPETRGRGHVGEALNRHRPRWAEQEAEKLRPTVEAAKAFVVEVLAGLEHIRLGLLEEMWSERGGHKWHLRLALRELRYRARRHEEYPGELFVYPLAAHTSEPEESSDTLRGRLDHYRQEMRQERKPPPARKGPYRRADGVYVHPGDCACEWCDEALELSYAVPRRIS